MDKLVKNMMFISSVLDTHEPVKLESKPNLKIATFEGQEPVKFKASATSSELKIAKCITEIVSEDALFNQGPAVIASNLRFASFDTTGSFLKPTAQNITDITKLVMEEIGYEVVPTPLGIVASTKSKDREVRFFNHDILNATEIYKNSLKFKKVAAILPDAEFVKGLAKKAYDVLVKVQPKNVSKCIAGIIHTLFFDYGMDKNIFLASSFYHELRTNYLDKIKDKFGVDNIRYYATGDMNKQLVEHIESNIDKAASHNKLYNKAKELYNGLSDRTVCDRLILMSELLGYDEKKVFSLASSLNKITKLEFNFGDV